MSVLLLLSATMAHAEDCDFIKVAVRPHNFDTLGIWNPSVKKFLTLWYHEIGHDVTFSSIQGRHISPENKFTAKQTYSFPLTEGSAVGSDYSIAYNSNRNEYLLAWNHVQGEKKSGLYIQRIDSSGNLVGVARRVQPDNSSPLNSSFPRVAYNSTNDEYLLGAGFDEIHFVRISSDAKSIIRTAALKDPLASFQSIKAILVDPDQPDYFVFWQSSRFSFPSNGEDLHFLQRISPDGSLKGTAKEIDLPIQAVEMNTFRKEFLVLFPGREITSSVFELLSVRLDTEGNLIADPSIIGRQVSNYPPALVYATERNGYLAVYERRNNQFSRLYGRKLGPNGLKVGNEIQLTCDPQVHSAHKLLHDPETGTYFVFWTTGAIIGGKLFHLP